MKINVTEPSASPYVEDGGQAARVECWRMRDEANSGSVAGRRGRPAGAGHGGGGRAATRRSEEHTSELQSLMRISYAVFCLKKKKKKHTKKSEQTISTHCYKYNTVNNRE